MEYCVIITMKLDPFLQQFLRGYYGCNSIVFEFPKGEDLLMRLEFFLTKPPRDFKPIEYGEHTFRIKVPKMEHKNPYSYYYLSDKKMALFSKRIKSFQRDVFHEEIGHGIREGMYRSEIITSLLEEYGIDPKFEDRVQREYSRFKKTLRQRKYREKSKKNLSVN